MTGTLPHPGRPLLLGSAYLFAATYEAGKIADTNPWITMYTRARVATEPSPPFVKHKNLQLYRNPRTLSASAAVSPYAGRAARSLVLGPPLSGPEVVVVCRCLPAGVRNRCAPSGHAGALAARRWSTAAALATHVVANVVPLGARVAIGGRASDICRHGRINSTHLIWFCVLSSAPKTL